MKQNEVGGTQGDQYQKDETNGRINEGFIIGITKMYGKEKY
jgi:hypothetical protein